MTLKDILKAELPILNAKKFYKGLITNFKIRGEELRKDFKILIGTTTGVIDFFSLSNAGMGIHQILNEDYFNGFFNFGCSVILRGVVGLYSPLEADNDNDDRPDDDGDDDFGPFPISPFGIKYKRTEYMKRYPDFSLSV